jgi:hypothetical protein
MEGTSDPAQLLALLRKRAIPVEQAKGTSPQDLQGRIIVGKLHHLLEKKEFSRALYESFPEKTANGDDPH